MRFHEFAAKDAEILSEWGGARAHPGYGMKIFRAGFYNYFAEAVSHIDDASIKEFIANWMAKIFKDDSSAFKPDAFLKAAMSTGYRNPKGTPTLQSRHFYYLAGEIKDIPDAHAREFVAKFIGELCEDANPQFKPERWMAFCGLTPHKPEKRQRTPRYNQMMGREPEALPASQSSRPPRDALDLD